MSTQVTITKIELIVACESVCSEGSIDSAINDMFGSCWKGGQHLAAGMIHAQELVYLDSTQTTIAEVEWNLEGEVV